MVSIFLKVSFISTRGDSDDGYVAVDNFQVLEDNPERVCEIIPSIAEPVVCEAGQYECPYDHTCISKVFFCFFNFKVVIVKIYVIV